MESALGTWCRVRTELRGRAIAESAVEYVRSHGRPADSIEELGVSDNTCFLFEKYRYWSEGDQFRITFLDPASWEVVWSENAGPWEAAVG